MALNKAQTSLGIKIILVLLIISVAASFVPFVGGVFSGQPATSTTGTDPVSVANAQYQPQVAALTNQLQSEPESYTVLVSLGNSYFDWAAALQQASQTTSSAVGADQPIWVAAKDAYGRALEVRDEEPPVQVDYAITLFYTGETTEAIDKAEQVAKDSPDFAPAHFNLGIFYAALNQNDKALASFERAVQLDPGGTQIGLDYANQQIDRLKSLATTPAP